MQGDVYCAACRVFVRDKHVETVRLYRFIGYDETDAHIRAMREEKK